MLSSGALTWSEEESASGPADWGRFLARLFLDSSMIMAASWEGSVLMEASAMAEAMVLMLSSSWLVLVLSGDTQPWLRSEPELSLWSGSAALLERVWGAERGTRSH